MKRIIERSRIYTNNYQNESMYDGFRNHRIKTRAKTPFRTFEFN